MATATTATSFVGLLEERTYVGRDKDTNDKKYRLRFRNVVFPEGEDHITQRSFYYIMSDEDELKSLRIGCRIKADVELDEDTKKWMANSLDPDDELEFEARFVSATRWKKRDGVQLWKFTLQSCHETGDEKLPWPRVGTFFYVSEDDSTVTELRRNTTYEFEAHYELEEKTYEIIKWEKI